jgi:perosamine synthetase
MAIPLSSPDITNAEIEAVTAVLRTPRLSQGSQLLEFERAFASWLGAEDAVALSSGTAALHLAIRACGIGEGDEVITTPLSFVASANAILYERARPIFVDVDPVSLNLDPARIEAAITPRTRAILPVHLFGRPAAMDEILDIARRRGLAVIEDACEALGAETSGKKAGTLGQAAAFGFYPNKPITTGEGGMLVTNDAAVAGIGRRLRNHGRDGDALVSQDLGYNYRLSELACAVGAVQMRRLPEILARREAVARAYDVRLAKNPDLVRPEFAIPGGRVGWFAYVVRLGQHFTASDRDRVATEMRARGIECQRYFSPLHLQPHIRKAIGSAEGDFPVAEAAAERTLALPFFGQLQETQVDEVCANLVAVLTLGHPSSKA